MALGVLGFKFSHEHETGQPLTQHPCPVSAGPWESCGKSLPLLLKLAPVCPVEDPILRFCVAALQGVLDHR